LHSLVTRLRGPIPSRQPVINYTTSACGVQGKLTDLSEGAWRLARIERSGGMSRGLQARLFARVGFFGKGSWRYRIPGFGRVDWPAFISTLKEVGYDGAVTVENEDPVFRGPRNLEGIRLGYNHLRPLICA